MRVTHLWLSLAFLVLMAPTVQPVEESRSTAENPSYSDQVSPEESESRSEAKDVIPPEPGQATSNEPVMPTSIFPEKKPYQQAQEELAHAIELWHSGHPEAASDTALEAYDDFMELHRVPGVKRITIREQMKQAAGIYIEAGIAYIRNHVKRMGGSPEAVEEGKARMEDLRDVSKNYKDLNKMLSLAIEQLGAPSKPPKPAPLPPATTTPAATPTVAPSTPSNTPK